MTFVGIPNRKPIHIFEKAHTTQPPLIHAEAAEHHIPGVRELRKAYFSGRTLEEKIVALRAFGRARAQAVRAREAQLNSTQRAFENFYLYSTSGIRFKIDVQGVNQTALAQLTAEAAKRKLKAYTQETQPHTLFFERIQE